MMPEAELSDQVSGSSNVGCGFDPQSPLLTPPPGFQHIIPPPPGFSAASDRVLEQAPTENRKVHKEIQYAIINKAVESGVTNISSTGCSENLTGVNLASAHRATSHIGSLTSSEGSSERIGVGTSSESKRADERREESSLAGVNGEIYPAVDLSRQLVNELPKSEGK